MFPRKFLLPALLAVVLPGLQAAESPLSFDAINRLALARHPGSLVTEVALQPAEAAQPAQAHVVLHGPEGLRNELQIDLASWTILKDEQKSLQSAAMLPLALGRGEQLPSWDVLNALVLKVHPGGRVVDASLRRVSHGGLLYEVEVLDAAGKEFELVLEADDGRVLSDRAID